MSEMKHDVYAPSSVDRMMRISIRAEFVYKARRPKQIRRINLDWRSEVKC